MRQAAPVRAPVGGGAPAQPDPLAAQQAKAEEQRLKAATAPKPGSAGALRQKLVHKQQPTMPTVPAAAGAPMHFESTPAQTKGIKPLRKVSFAEKVSVQGEPQQRMADPAALFPSPPVRQGGGGVDLGGGGVDLGTQSWGTLQQTEQTQAQDLHKATDMSSLTVDPHKRSLHERMGGLSLVELSDSTPMDDLFSGVTKTTPKPIRKVARRTGRLTRSRARFSARTIRSRSGTSGTDLPFRAQRSVRKRASSPRSRTKRNHAPSRPPGARKRATSPRSRRGKKRGTNLPIRA